MEGREMNLIWIYNRAPYQVEDILEWYMRGDQMFAVIRLKGGAIINQAWIHEMTVGVNA